ncbi:M23 family metallopeptidase [Thermohalobacter berrensis]|uniref:M23ase beta-sheet core domain-containing protein n=1 Tax=Thermohalobacter berrensis TaxID=99594 RepID=A0A419T0E2_9FIRM|nr:M23 family metallopeptidase [Thermohalobacter berrensis]RKD30927.1 hypothetical protein BET03_13065 [Thermohalobacter berrensis]
MGKNNDISPKKRTNIFKFFEKEGFYIILFICICIVATTAVWVSKNNLEKINSLKNKEETNLVEEPNIEDFPLMEDIEEDVDIKDDSDVKAIKIDKPSNTQKTKDKVDEVKETKDNLQVTKDKGAKPQEEQKTKPTSSTNSTQVETKEKNTSQPKPTTDEPKVKAASRTMTVPLYGNISMDYAEDKLVYSKTLEQWTTHKGIDIKAREGSVVKAVLDGTITEIKHDPGLGIVITIDHGNGLKTRYGNLSTDEMVEVGQKIKKGDPISGVGKGTGFEAAQGPHLHFEVIKNGKNVDPKLYIPKFK